MYLIKHNSIHIDNKDVYLGSIIFIMIMGVFFVIPLVNLVYTQTLNFLMNQTTSMRFSKHSKVGVSESSDSAQSSRKCSQESAKG